MYFIIKKSVIISPLIKLIFYIILIIKIILLHKLIK